MNPLKLICLIFGSLLLAGNLQAQDLEPRRWSLLPSDTNFIGVGLGHVSGDIFFDPVLEAEDVDFDLNVLGFGYIRTFDFLGKSARLDVNLPYAKAQWDGLLRGEPAIRKRQGFMDPSMRLSMNLYGGPALKGKEFAAFRAANPVNTTVGAALAVFAPLGEYNNEKLLNLGGNRWSLRPQLGVLHEREKWQFEATLSTFLFGDNTSFYPGKRTREQDPLWSMQGHVIYTFRPGLWAGLSSAFAWGGRSTVQNVEKDDDARVSFWALSAGYPISRTQGLKAAYIMSRTNNDSGSDLDTFQLGWSLMFGR